MPTKACCCGKGHWIAIPCRYWGTKFFGGYNDDGFTGFAGNASMSQIQQLLRNNPALGVCGPFGILHPYFPFPDFDFGYTSVPIKIKGISCADQSSGGAFGTYNGGFGGCIQQKCYDLILDEERGLLYKAWGAGGGGKSINLPGGNGAYTQKRGPYNKNYVACVGFGGLGANTTRSVTGWTGNISTVPGGGGQGFGSWGGGAAFVSENMMQPQSAFLIAGGGGGAGNDSSGGGHGGVTAGKKANGPEGGFGGNQTQGGCGGCGAQSGIVSSGGRGSIVGGGGGGGGFRGGGGGGKTGFGGGGGSSTLNPLARSGTDNGPPNMCDPMYWTTDVSSIGGLEQINGVVGYVPKNNSENGMPGKIAIQFAALRCPCNESLSEIPDKTYICLTDEQAGYICNVINNCCGTCGSCGASGYYPCGGSSLIGFDTIIDGRGTTGAVNRGSSGPAKDFPIGGGCGGAWVGAFICTGVCGSCGPSGFTLPNETPTGEVPEVKYRTFKYDGELYYLSYQCGVLCDPDYLVPEDAVFTDIGCRPYADCCKGLYALPICEITNEDDKIINCFSVNNCPCQPVQICPEPFISCQNPDDYPDIFYTKKDNWYYLVWKTSLWEPFGDQFYNRGSIGEVILENPCDACSNPFGDGPQNNDCENQEGGTNPGNNTGGQGNPPNCCVEVREFWSGTSPYRANVNVSISFNGRLPFDVGCNKIETCDCDFDGSYSDSASYNVTYIDPNNGTYTESRDSGNCELPPVPGCFNPPFTSGSPTYFLYSVFPIDNLGTYPRFNNDGPAGIAGLAGSGWAEGCFDYSASCGIVPDITGLPDASAINDRTFRDPGYSVVAECVVVDPDNPDCIPYSSVPEAYIPIYREYGDFGPGCENDTGEPSNEGPRIIAAGCRLSTYVQKLNQYSGGKYVATQLGPDSYWIGGKRSLDNNIPGDNFNIVEYNTTFITQGNKIIQRAEMIVYFSSPLHSITVYYQGKPLPKCCVEQPCMAWGQSECGLARPLEYACDPVPGPCEVIERNVVRTWRTLQQFEENPNVTMVNPRCWICSDGFICPEMYDDYDGSQTCTITLT
jgi:hypothetical protein